MKPQIEERAVHWSRWLACHLKQLFSWPLFPVSKRAAMYHWPFPEGPGREDPFTLRSYPQTLLTRIRWQFAIPEGAAAWTSPYRSQISLWCTNNSVHSQSQKSHAFPIHFLIFFSLYFHWHIAKVILPSLFLFFSTFLVPIGHRWKRNARQRDAAKLNLAHLVKYQEQLHTWVSKHTQN